MADYPLFFRGWNANAPGGGTGPTADQNVPKVGKFNEFVHGLNRLPCRQDTCGTILQTNGCLIVIAR